MVGAHCRGRHRREEEGRGERGKGTGDRRDGGALGADSWPGGDGAGEREPGPGPDQSAGYLSEEAGDHLLEGVLVHLVHVHGDPHPRPPRLRERRPARVCPDRRRPHAGGRRGVGFLISFFKLWKLYCPRRETDKRSRPAPFRQRPVWAAGPRGAPAGAGRPSPPGGAVPAARSVSPRSCLARPASGPRTWGLCFCVIAASGALE